MSGRRPATPEQPARRPLVVVTYNVHGFVGSDGLRRPQRAMEIIQEIQPDIVGLQEVDEHFVDRLAGIQLAQLATAMGLEAVKGNTLVRQTGAFGNALLSRYRIIDSQRLDLSVTNREPRGALDVKLDYEGLRLRVVVTHLGLRMWERRQQLRLLEAAIAKELGPLILMGDLNICSVYSPLYRGFSRQFSRWRSARSFPAQLPLLPLDRILVRPSRGLSELFAYRGGLASVASDHLPVVGLLDQGALQAAARHRQQQPRGDLRP